MKTKTCKYQYYVTARRSNGELVYFVNSPTQGPNVIPFALSLAYRFETLKAARETVARYSVPQRGWFGITNWKTNRANRN